MMLLQISLLFKIVALICILFNIILISAYIELHFTKRWYEKQFHSNPRVPYRYIPKISWQQRLVNVLLLRRPVHIKQHFRHIPVRREVAPKIS